MILVAATSFKGTYSAAAVTRTMAQAAEACGYGVVARPVSDGGPGLIEALHEARGGRIETVSVHGPLGDAVNARILLQGDRAIVESADACGLHLVPPARRDPTVTTTYGVGELLLAAAEVAHHIVIGLGGSATVDGGRGLRKALGGRSLPAIIALYDVRNPLIGENGAARVFGPQKGANARQVEQLEAELKWLAAEMRCESGIDVAQLAGAGAAGGLGAGLVAFTGAHLMPGSSWVLHETGVDALIEKAELLITGEGAFDTQSSMGKITGELIERAQAANVPVLLIAGRIEGELPANVHGATSGSALALEDIAQLVRAAVPRLLSP